jgi:uncharacterized membrane protein YbhN (UPF0104 family)
MAKLPSAEERGWDWRLRVGGTILSFGLLILLLWRQDWSMIFRAMISVPAWALIAGLAFLLMRHACNTARWVFLVRAQEIPLTYRRALQLVFAGLFVSNFLPSMVGGDVVRIAGVISVSRSKVAGAASVVVDRLIGVFGMLFVLPFSFPLLKGLISSGGILGFGLTTSDGRWMEVLKKSVRRGSEALRLWLHRPYSLGLALLASWMAVFSYLICVWILARGLGIPVGLKEVAGVSALTYFLTLIPISINGYGLRELAILGFYTQLGATSEQAAALALITRVFFLLVSVLGVFWIGKVVPEGVDEVLQRGKEPS